MRLSLVLGAALALATAVARPAAAEDRNGNGLEDGFEQALLDRFAPVVILAPGEWALPSSVDWFVARARLERGSGSPPAAVQASVLGELGAALESLGRGAWLRPDAGARRGSRDPRDWVVYGHVYPGRGGGLLVQYWFFYPFNRSYGLFDHEGDWEHVTVRLDGGLRPLGAWYARHEQSAPGRWFEWGALAREGEHPVVLAARGSHASYADPGDAAFYDRVCPTRDPAAAPADGCRVWRTWGRGTGGVVFTGPRDRPRARAAFVSWPVRWGAAGKFWRDSGGPPGPAFQPGWCAEGAEPCS